MSDFRNNRDELEKRIGELQERLRFATSEDEAQTIIENIRTLMAWLKAAK